MAGETSSIEAILERTKYGRWEERELFLHISQDYLKDFVASLVSRFNTRLTSISIIEHSGYFEFFYHFIINNVPLNLITKVSKEAPSFQSISDILNNSDVYEEELLDILKERSWKAQ